jgi:peptidoglycan hydrolase-like protein with peptidoglycan-binding domain
LPLLTSPGPYAELIKQVQEKLHEHGFDAGPVNGAFGTKTQAALAQYQLAVALPASGMLDDDTLRALGIERAERSAPGPEADDMTYWNAPVRDSETVAAAQRALRAAGYDPGPADGSLRPQTTEALKQAQQDRELESTGQLDRRTVAALGVSLR